MVQQVEMIANASARSPAAFELDQGLKGVYSHPNFVHDRELKTVQFKKNRPVVLLSPTENRLLTELEQLPNEFISNAKLVKRVFGGHSAAYVKKNVLSLRQKMESDPNTPRVIAIVDDRSYRLVDMNRFRLENLEKEVVYSYDGGRIIYYPDLFFVLADRRRVGLAGIESELLGLLAKNSGEVVEHETIYRELWGDDVGLDILKASLNKLIQRVRRRIRDRQGEGGEFCVIRSIHGEGYGMGHEDRPQLENLSTMSLWRSEFRPS